MPPVLPPMPPTTVHRHWPPAPSASEYKYDERDRDRDWDEYVRPTPPSTRALPPTEHPVNKVPAVPKSSRASTSKAASNKRAAQVAGDVSASAEPPKKRRKDDQPASSNVSVPTPVPVPASSTATKRVEERVPVQTDLSTLPVSSLVSYLVKHDIIPPIHPSPYTSQATLAPSILLHPPTHTPPPPPPPPTPAHQQQVSNSDRRRSSRFQEDDLIVDDTAPPSTHHVPILTDLDAVHGVLAKLVERHWHGKTVREQDTIAGFVWSAQRARERTLLAASSAGHG